MAKSYVCQLGKDKNSVVAMRHSFRRRGVRRALDRGAIPTLLRAWKVGIWPAVLDVEVSDLRLVIDARQPGAVHTGAVRMPDGVVALAIVAGEIGLNDDFAPLGQRLGR